jgi:DNA-directed RNA polymerase specialized sigma24 family protein
MTEHSGVSPRDLDRPPQVQTDIAQILPVNLVRWVTLPRDQLHALRPETLVFMVRHIPLQGHDTLLGSLLYELATRAYLYAYQHIHSYFPPCVREEMAEDVGHLICTTVVQRDSPQAADLERMFWKVVGHRLIDVIRKAQSRLGLDNDHPPEEEGAGKVPLFVKKDATAIASPYSSRYADRGAVQQVAVQQVLERFPRLKREAFLLYYVGGYVISSRDPSIPSVTRQLGRSDKTIRL